MLQMVLELARTMTAILFLSYASWSDYKKREVNDMVWLIFAPAAFALTFPQIYFYEPSQLTLYGVSFGATAAFSLIIFYAGGFGGADAKALMCLALALPFYPTNLLEPLFGISPISQVIFPLTFFSNSVLLAALSAAGIIVYNVFWALKTRRKLFGTTYQNASIWMKTLILITGYKAPIKKLKEKWHVYPLEAIEQSTDSFKRRLIAVPRDEGRDDVVRKLDEAVAAGTIQDGVWATPGLPFLIFVTLGLIIGIFFGDIIWTAIRALLG